MASFALPRTLTLPSKRRVTLRRRKSGPVAARSRAEGGPRFSEVLALFDDDEVRVEEKGRTLDVRDLALGDFHVLRALLTKAKLVFEEEVELDCHNCGEQLIVRPCEGMETGPWEDGELDDPELDWTAELGVALEIAPLPLGRVREAHTVTLAPRTVREAMPLFAALEADPLEVTEDVVRAMGVEALGPIDDPAHIARILSECDALDFGSVTDVFLEAHYSLRLACDLFCGSCKARNTVDAPYEREFEPLEREPDDEAGPSQAAFPPLEEFVELAHAIAEPQIARIPGEKVELIVESDTPAVDDGGEPLLGSYVPPPPRDAPVPVTPPTVTIYYRTFEAAAKQASFDWEDELRETIEHELEHHIFYLRGDDPMDEEEHAEIDREVVRVVGRGEATRRTLAVFGLSIPDFFARAWPLVLIGAAVLAITLAQAHCGSTVD